MGFQIKVTTAGRAALVNAANTGTLPVTVSQLGVTATAVTPTVALTSLAGEIKRISLAGGIAAADDTIHVTARDESADTYTLRSFGLYLADGTLFAVYGQATPILEKSAQSVMMLVADVIFADIDAASLTFGDAEFINPPATTEVQGVVELATNAEANTGTDTARAVTAAGVKYTLDQRFGTGAPSVFVKGLLNLATATLLRASLAIKSAALKDEGHGNGLDADLLDGQHGAHYLTYGNLTGVPLTFAPSAHNHAATDINSGTFVDARISQSSVKQHEAALAIAYSQLTGVPLTFAPSAHSHTIANVTGLQSALDAKVDAVAPVVTGASAATVYQNNAVTTGNMTTGGGDGSFSVHITARSNSDNRVAQFGFVPRGGTSTPEAYIRSHHTTDGGGGGWTGWARLWHAGNFDPAAKVDASAVDVNATASKVPTRDGSADLHARLFRSNYADQLAMGGALAFRTNNTTDNYIRFCSDAAAIRSWLGAAPLLSPALTGTPTAPTAAAGANTTQVATTAFVFAGLALKMDKTGGAFSGGVNFGSDVVANGMDLSRHLALHASAGYGFSVSSNQLNYVVNASGKHSFYTGASGTAVLVAQISQTLADFNVPLTANTLQATTSDGRLKEDIADLRDGLATILQLRPRSYRWKESGQADAGYIAQEHEKVMPGAVFEKPSVVEGERGRLHVRYGAELPYLVAAVQEIAARLEAIEARIGGV